MEPFRRDKRFEPALLVDVSQRAKDTYLKNFPGANYALRDLETLSPKKLLGLAGGEVDILLGCPPCQGYSDNGARLDSDPRNAHVNAFAAFVSALRPMAVALENVPLTVASDRFQAFLKSIEKAGYAWSAGVLNAALYGSCQSRQRLIFVAIRNDLRQVPSIPKPTHGGGTCYSYHHQQSMLIAEDARNILGLTPGSLRTQQMVPESHQGMLGKKWIPTVGEVLSGLPKARLESGRVNGHSPWGHKEEVLKRMEGVPEGGQWTGDKKYFSQSYARLHRDGLARTITRYFPNPGSGRFWHPTENRSLTLREAARIQGFPDSFQFLEHATPGANCDLVGNALDARFAEVAYSAIQNSLN